MAYFDMCVCLELFYENLLALPAGAKFCMTVQKRMPAPKVSVRLSSIFFKNRYEYLFNTVNCFTTAGAASGEFMALDFAVPGVNVGATHAQRKQVEPCIGGVDCTAPRRACLLGFQRRMKLKYPA